MKRILIVGKSLEDQARLRELLEGEFGTTFTPFGGGCYQAIIDEMPGLIILALTHSGEQAFDTCSRLRSSVTTSQIPIIILADPASPELHSKAFNVGADDVVQEPFASLDLRSRIRSKLKRAWEKTPHAPRIRCGNLNLDLDSYECWIGNRQVTLSVLEFNLLKHFIENFGRISTREEILKSVWKRVTVSQRAIDTHVTSLRKKIQDSNLGFQTTYGLGYSLKRLPSAESTEAVSVASPIVKGDDEPNGAIPAAQYAGHI